MIQARAQRRMCRVFGSIEDNCTEEKEMNREKTKDKRRSGKSKDALHFFDKSIARNVNALGSLQRGPFVVRSDTPFSLSAHS